VLPELTPQPRAIINGWFPDYEYSILVDWKRIGEAASLGDDSGLPRRKRDQREALIRVHRVTTLEEYTATVRMYRALAERHSIATDTFDHALSCLFRGQTRDYLGADDAIVSWPAVFRSRSLASEYLDLSRDAPMAREWGQWATVITSLTQVGDEAGRLYGFSDPLQPDRKTAPPLADRSLSGRLSTNVELMALGMHYGFPTPSLDVTPDESVALWFALNVGRTDAEGLIHYESNLGTPGTVEGPSVYVFIQRNSSESPVVDLTAAALSRDRALRPFVQHAWALPFYRHAMQLSGGMDSQFGRISAAAKRWPSAVIKPVFGMEEAAKARALHNPLELFPPDDPLYRALHEANVPRLARYAL
jgi:hypothetical protein